MEFLIEYGLFLAKAVTLVIAIIVIIGAIVSAGSKSKSQQHPGSITITNLSEELSELETDMRKEIMDKEAFKQFQKAQKQSHKQQAKEEPQSTDVASERLFIVDFNGDVQASAVENLREELSAIIGVAEQGDEVLVRLESPGGMVHSYGLAASQLQRLKSRGIKLNVAVDEVAASGGYMMACVADRIYSAPFAIIGSIGVLGQLPNFSRLLKQNHVDFEQHTAGEFKRTLTMFGENTDKAREKFKEDLENTHQLFKAFITENRPELDIDRVATGEHWYGREALELGLVDQVITSDDIILKAAKDKTVFKVKYEIKKPLSERLPISLLKASHNALLNLWYRGESQKFYK